MIWITGDKHGQIEAFEEDSRYKKIKKRDTLIVCGDFGFVWDGSKQEMKNLKWLDKRKYTIAFVDGCHENFDLLSHYPIVDFCGGKARELADNIYQLMRGELYEIDGKKVLSFGGGISDNHDEDLLGISWWKAEAPTDKEISNAIESLKKAEGEVDLIVSYEPPLSIKPCMEEMLQDSGTIHEVLEQIRTHCSFKMWYFGKYHVDKHIPPSYVAVFEKLLKYAGD